MEGLNLDVLENVILPSLDLPSQLSLFFVDKYFQNIVSKPNSDISKYFRSKVDSTKHPMSMLISTAIEEGYSDLSDLFVGLLTNRTHILSYQDKESILHSCLKSANMKLLRSYAPILLRYFTLTNSAIVSLGQCGDVGFISDVIEMFNVLDSFTSKDRFTPEMLSLSLSSGTHGKADVIVHLMESNWLPNDGKRAYYLEKFFLKCLEYGIERWEAADRAWQLSTSRHTPLSMPLWKLPDLFHPKLEHSKVLRLLEFVKSKVGDYILEIFKEDLPRNAYAIQEVFGKNDSPTLQKWLSRTFEIDDFVSLKVALECKFEGVEANVLEQQDRLIDRLKVECFALPFDTFAYFVDFFRIPLDSWNRKLMEIFGTYFARDNEREWIQSYLNRLSPSALDELRKLCEGAVVANKIDSSILGILEYIKFSIDYAFLERHAQFITVSGLQWLKERNLLTPQLDLSTNRFLDMRTYKIANEFGMKIEPSDISIVEMLKKGKISLLAHLGKSNSKFFDSTCPEFPESLKILSAIKYSDNAAALEALNYLITSGILKAPALEAKLGEFAKGHRLASALTTTLAPLTTVVPSPVRFPSSSVPFTFSNVGEMSFESSFDSSSMTSSSRERAKKRARIDKSQ